MRPNADYIAQRPIFVHGVRGYNPGDDIHTVAVENLGLTVGVDVLPARPDVIPRPAKDALRPDWVAYWLGQGMSQQEIDELNRNQLAEKEPEVIGGVDPSATAVRVESPMPDNTAAQAAPQLAEPAERVERPGQGARKADWVAYAVWRGMAKETAEDSTIPQLATTDYDNLFGPERHA
ncbi:hypothetical protein OOJ91_12290 [Micromonospora lupini]|uniref:hypothetical protein n=1 Tax=Micromonospora lupini TaxID=285679 RepID=UPI00224F0F74|nr:hypothetical protein [Micromonospora lupini]MCX5066658.1 hypothetical protein [Micromonospora lupini]